MLSRKEHGICGKPLKEGELTILLGIFSEAYAEKILSLEKKFDIFTFIYDDEFLVIVSLISVENLSTIPISLFLSADITTSSNVPLILKKIVDLSGLFFDDIFFSAEECDYISHWTMVKPGEEQLFYKVTRENVALSLQADQILS